MPRPTHKISTGKAENKFGIPIAARARSMRSAAKLPACRSPASTCISAARSPNSQPFDDAFALLADSCAMLRADGHAIEHVDLGGGLGIPYRDDNEPPPMPDAYAAVVKRKHAELGLQGDLRAGPADRRQCRHPGIEVIYVKEGEAKNFVIVDAAMNDLIRPTLYDAYHDIGRCASRPPARRASSPTSSVRSAKPVIPGARPRPAAPQPGDLVAVMTAGAYGAVQAGTYNSPPLVPEVLVDGDRMGDRASARRRPHELFGIILGRERFAKISAVEGIELHPR